MLSRSAPVAVRLRDPREVTHFAWCGTQHATHAVATGSKGRNIKAMTHEQLATFLAFSSARCSRRNHVLDLLLADAGLRPDEVCAVKWSDFDMLAKTLRIERAAADTGRIKETKTGEDREVDLSPRLVAALCDFRATGSRRASRWARRHQPVGVRHAGREAAEATSCGQDLSQGPAGGRAPALSPLRPSAHVRQSSDRAGRRHCVRGEATRPREDDDDASVLRSLVPKGDRHYVERMESVRVSAAPLNLPTPHDDSGAVLDAEEAPNERSWHHFGTTSESGAPDVSGAPDFDGGPSGTRTPDPLIKSQLLCQLS